MESLVTVLELITQNQNISLEKCPYCYKPVTTSTIVDLDGHFIKITVDFSLKFFTYTLNVFAVAQVRELTKHQFSKGEFYTNFLRTTMRLF